MDQIVAIGWKLQNAIKIAEEMNPADTLSQMLLDVASPNTGNPATEPTGPVLTAAPELSLHSNIASTVDMVLDNDSDNGNGSDRDSDEDTDELAALFEDDDDEKTLQRISAQDVALDMDVEEGNNLFDF
ncbi:hypothetical protein C8J56DRAFT_1045610 [Mycena floridula]|nr:hypothetical protein C8J56DRAFT_1045610 [Mycena floridula]